MQKNKERKNSVFSSFLNNHNYLVMGCVCLLDRVQLFQVLESDWTLLPSSSVPYWFCTLLFIIATTENAVSQRQDVIERNIAVW